MLKLWLALFLILSSGLSPVRATTGADSPTSDAPVQFEGFHLVLYVEDVRQSVRFYEEALGFKLVHFVIGSAKEVIRLSASDPDPYAALLVAGDQKISLQRNSGEVPLPATGARFHFTISNPATYYARLTGHKLKIHHLVRSINDEPFMFSVTDPDGHWLFFQGPIANGNK